MTGSDGKPDFFISTHWVWVDYRLDSEFRPTSSESAHFEMKQIQFFFSLQKIGFTIKPTDRLSLETRLLLFGNCRKQEYPFNF